MSSDDALKQFISELLELKLHAGSPPLREIIKCCDVTPPGEPKPSPPTLSNLFTCNITRPPRWELVYAVVTGLRECAAARSLTLNSQEREITWWKRRLERLELDLTGSEPRIRSARGDAVLAELRPRVKTWKGNSLPTLAILSEDAATSQNDVPPALGSSYIPRPEFDEEMQLALQAPAEPFPFLLVYGDAGAGKTTSAWNAVQTALDPRTEVIVPRGGKALAEIAFIPNASSAVQPPALIWADGISAGDMEYLTAETLEHLSSFAIVIGTISADDCGVILNANGSRAMPVARAAFGRAYPLHITFDPTIAERLADEEDLNFGQAESHVDPRLMWLRLNTARSVSPAGMAIVRSAIDCRRAGLMRPLTEEELKRLFPVYLAEITRISASDELFATGMEWAQESSSGTAPMLRAAHYPEEGHSAWVASNALRAEEAPWVLPKFIWPELIEIANPRECLSIAHQAGEFEELLYAATALAKAATEQEFYLRASLHRGKFLRRLGDLPAAKDCFTAIINYGVSREASAAAYLMGVISNEDDAEEAVRYWTLATEMPGEFSLMAWFELGRYYIMSGERERAITALDRDFSVFDPVSRGASPTLGLRASALLGFVRNSSSDLRSDLDELERRAADGSSEAATIAEVLRSYVERTDQLANDHGSPESFHIDSALAEGQMYSVSGDLRRALQAFRSTAATAERSDVRAAALCMAGDTAEELGLLAEAKEDYSQCITCNDPKYSASAALSLGAILYKENDYPRAIRAWGKAKEIGDRQVRTKASFNIGVAYHDAGDHAAAAQEFDLVLRNGSSDFQARAAMMLAETYEDMGAQPAVIDGYYQQALDVDDPEYSPIAALTFGGRIYERDGSSPRAIELIRIASESQNDEAHAKGSWLLGHMLEERESFNEAISAYEAAISTGHPDWQPAGHLSLGLLYGVQNRKNIGMRHLQAAYDSHHPEYRIKAAYWIGMFYWWDGTHENRAKLRNAEDMLRQVIAAPDSEPWAPAGVALGSILVARGDREAAISIWRQVYASGIEPHATDARMKLAEYGTTDR